MKSTKTKMMNRFIICISGIFFLIIYCVSCEYRKSERLEILIQNGTDSHIHITLYSKGDIGGLYPICDGCGEHRNTQYSLNTNTNDSYQWSEVVYYTSSDLSIKPYTLATKAFDSIYISTDNVILKFTPENVTGYSENLFEENSIWNYKIRVHNLSDFSKSIVNAHCYTFLILKDKIIIE